MSAPYLNELETVLRSGVRDLHEAAERLGLSFETVCLTFNNGLLKEWWQIEVPPLPDEEPRCKEMEAALREIGNLPPVEAQAPGYRNISDIVDTALAHSVSEAAPLPEDSQ